MTPSRCEPYHEMVIMFRHTNNSVLSFASAEVRIVMGTSSGLGVLCDVIITASLCYYLHSSRTGFRRFVSVVRATTTVASLMSRSYSTNSMINKLIVYAVNRGTLTASASQITLSVLPADGMSLLPAFVRP